MMEGSQEKIKQIFMNPLFLLFLLLQFVIIVLFITSLSGIFNNAAESDMQIAKDTGSHIKNIKEIIPELKASESELIENSVFSLASQYSKRITSKTEGEVRKDTLIKKEFNAQNITYYNFIVDIPELKLSYQIKYERSDDDENVYLSPDAALVLTCISDKEKVKYKEQSCIDTDQKAGSFEVIRQYLQYSDFGDLSAVAEDDKKIIINATASDKTEEEAVTVIQDWIKSMGYSPDGITILANKGEYLPENED